MSASQEHLTAARAWLRWALARPGVSVAAPEIAFAGGRLDAVAVSGSAVESEYWGAEWAAEIEAAIDAGRRVRNPNTRPPVHHGPLVLVAEVKVTRADLLADLRARKMHGYARLATHAYLVVSPAALCCDPERHDLGSWRRALKMLSIPDGWGVCIVRGADLTSARPARRLRDATEAECCAWRSRIGRSLSWRSLTDHDHCA